MSAYLDEWSAVGLEAVSEIAEFVGVSESDVAGWAADPASESADAAKKRAFLGNRYRAIYGATYTDLGAAPKLVVKVGYGASDVPSIALNRARERAAEEFGSSHGVSVAVEHI